jgi:signal transduction histidine kinase
MKAKRSGPVLLLGFGALIGLAAISGIEALQRAKETYRDISALNDRYRRLDRILEAVGSGIYVASLLTRDYLIDPSNDGAAEYRERLAAGRSAMEKDLRELAGMIRSEDRPRLEVLRRQVESYCDTWDSVFEWDREQKVARRWAFLQREGRPRRQAALSIAAEISNLTQANMVRERQEIDRKNAAMASFIGRMLAFTVLLGAAIAGGTVFRMTRLETTSERQRLRTEEAERELRRLSRQLVQAQEDERRSISRELHDEVGQMLTALRMELGNFQDLRTAPEGQFAEHLDDAKRLAEQSLRSLRDLATGLRPAMLDDLGLGAAVQWQARQFARRTGIPVNVQIEGVPAALPEPYRTCIYRVVQEALTNCARHSQAKTILVRIEGRKDGLSVSVRDDGVGFDPAGVRGRGLGLIGLQERVLELGGELTLTSRARQGAVLAAAIPFGREVTRNECSHSAC